MSDPVLVLREALAKATEGPWAVDVSHEDADSGGDPNVPDEYWTLEISAGDESLLYSATLDDPTDDAQFVVAARNLLPVLLDEVEALRKVVEDVKALHVVGPTTVVFQSAYQTCAGCSQYWPCPTARLLAVLDKEEDSDE